MAGKGLTLLEQYEAQQALAEANKKQRQQRNELAGNRQRALQIALGLFGVQIAAGMLTAGFVVCAAAMGIEPTAMPTTEPTFYLIGGVLVPALAVLLAIPLCLRGVYLAQLVGAAVGGAGALLLSLERVYYGMGPSWIEWLIVPPLGAAVGFLAGLKVAGNLPVEAVAEFKPIDSWDRDAKMNVHELDVHISARIRGVAFGVLTGLVGGWLAWLAMVKLLMPMYHYNLNSVESLLARIELPFSCLVVFLAGAVAGAGTKTGAVQGLLCGVGLFGAHYLWHRPDSTVEMMGLAAVQVLPAIVGGLAGRFVFPPSRVHVSELDGVGGRIQSV